MNSKICLVFCLVVSVTSALYRAPGIDHSGHGRRNGGWGGNTWPSTHPSLLRQDIFGNDGIHGIQHFPGSDYFPSNSWGSRRNAWSGSSYPRSIETHRLNGRRYKRSLYRSPYSNQGNRFGINRDSHFDQQLNGLDLSNQQIFNNQHLLGNQQLLNNQHLIGNQQLLNNQHLGNQQLLNNQHLLGNQQLLNNQHLLGNQQLLGNQHLLGNQQLLGNQHLLGNQQWLDNQQIFRNQNGGGIRRNIFPRRRY